MRKGAEIVVSIVVRDPAGKSYSPYSFPNPSLAQIGMDQPLDMPVLDHVDVIRGMVTGYKTPGAADYSGAWPNDWIDRDNPQQLKPLSLVPDAAKNTSAAVLTTYYNENASSTPRWTTVAGNTEYKKMTFRIPAVQASQYVRLRGTNLPPAVPFETDANGNPLADLWTNAAAVRFANANRDRVPGELISCASPVPQPARSAWRRDVQQHRDRWLPQPPASRERPEDGRIRRRSLGGFVGLRQSDLRRGGRFVRSSPASSKRGQHTNNPHINRISI